jgi:hypothetical protein
MEAKEKARELVDKFAKEAWSFHENTEWDYDKYCALICVDEILENITEEVMTYKPFMMNTDYWQEVKEEINKL